MHTRRTHFWDAGHLTACMEKEEFGVHNIQLRLAVQGLWDILQTLLEA